MLNATQQQATTTSNRFNNLVQASLLRSSSTIGDRVPYRVARLQFVHMVTHPRAEADLAVRSESALRHPLFFFVHFPLTTLNCAIFVEV